MHKGWLSGFGRHRRWIVQAVTLALVLPVLIGLLPQPALSAAAALERDLALSLCNPSGGNDPAKPVHRSSAHEACILCSSCASGSSPAHGAPAPVPELKPSGSEAKLIVVAFRLPPSAARLPGGSSPRGPPAVPAHSGA